MAVPCGSCADSCVEDVRAEVLRGLRMKTGFSAAELFRKYLWYALRERKFDADAVADLVHLREQLDLSDDQVSRASACGLPRVVSRRHLGVVEDR